MAQEIQACKVTPFRGCVIDVLLVEQKSCRAFRC